ncbi:unnamed protein product [Cylicocyclus nassatus]|uniref:Uncharacterized protein n=1 Tax=Cylicocyclus nassatus TaxID=53992 RepID=A0AA36HE37_CYLNA|nr:unnamed protein product [Cylicocyclus nassatus]
MGSSSAVLRLQYHVEKAAAIFTPRTDSSALVVLSALAAYASAEQQMLKRCYRQMMIVRKWTCKSHFLEAAKRIREDLGDGELDGDLPSLQQSNVAAQGMAVC